MNDETMPVRVVYDEEADAAYIYLADLAGVGGVAETVPVDPLAVHGMINLDFDAEGRLVGVEVLAASQRLPRSLLKPRTGSD